MELIQCTLADRHFCALNTGLYHIDTSQWCMIALFLKDNDKINSHCRLVLDNITRHQAHYLDQGLWAISIEMQVPMEIKCEDHNHFKTLEPPFSLINLQPASSAFSSVMKLPPYFKQYSSCFHVAWNSANLHIPKFTPFSVRIWKHFDLSDVTKPNVQNLRILTPAPNIPIQPVKSPNFKS